MKDSIPILSHFGLVVKELRRKKQLSQEELANRCGLHRTYITDIEHGTRNVSLKNISKIAHAVEESLQDVFAYVERFSRHNIHPHENLIQPGQDQNVPVEILLVENDQGSIDQVKEEMQRGQIGNTIHVVRSGEEALRFLFPVKADENKSNHIPKLILLSLRLPNVSGLEVLERIRKEKSTKATTVVILAPSMIEVDKERCQRLGVAEYLTKPFGAESFTEVMRRVGFQLFFFSRDGVYRE